MIFIFYFIIKKNLLPLGSREAAFTYAISSAGAVHAITGMQTQGHNCRNFFPISYYTFSITASCARGNISLCGCDSMQKMAYHEQNQAWKWGGCSADINFGMKFARKFLDAREIEGTLCLLMRIHSSKNCTVQYNSPSVFVFRRCQKFNELAQQPCWEKGKIFL